MTQGSTTCEKLVTHCHPTRHGSSIIRSRLVPAITTDSLLLVPALACTPAIQGLLYSTHQSLWYSSCVCAPVKSAKHASASTMRDCCNLIAAQVWRATAVCLPWSSQLDCDVLCRAFARVCVRVSGIRALHQGRQTGSWPRELAQRDIACSASWPASACYRKGSAL